MARFVVARFACPICGRLSLWVFAEDCETVICPACREMQPRPAFYTPFPPNACAAHKRALEDCGCLADTPREQWPG